MCAGRHWGGPENWAVEDKENCSNWGGVRRSRAESGWPIDQNGKKGDQDREQATSAVVVKERIESTEELKGRRENSMESVKQVEP